jgi:predicted amidohydrolase YtcJ
MKLKLSKSRLNFIQFLASIAMTGMLFMACQGKKQVDLVVYNAQVYTVDGDFSVQEAFAVQDGKFVAIGSTASIQEKYDGLESIDLGGAPVYPGFYDAHSHFWGFAKTLMQADLMGAASFDEIVTRLKTFREEFPEAQWLLGRGWDQNLWPVKTFPDRAQLDAAFPDIPVYIVRVDGHAALANTKALELAEITSAYPIDGGSIETKNGRLTGILVDNAMNAVVAKIPQPNEAEMVALLKKAEYLNAQVGLTTVSDAGLDQPEINFLDQLYQKQELKIRNHAWVNISDENLDHYLAKGPYKTDKFTVATFKILADGALGSRGACLLAPYSDDPSQGFLLYTPETIENALSRIIDSEFQVATHAIGDSTNRFILDAYGKHLKGKNERRWRVEHAQILAPGDLEKFGKFSIIPSVQPTHATSDMFWAIDRIGADRLKGAYTFKDLLAQNGVLPLGSDFPVEHINPIYGFHAAVARVDHRNLPEGGFQMENALSREEALRGMTIWSAYSFFEEDSHGSIEVGKAADFVVLDTDLMTAPFEKLRATKVKLTVVGGQTLYSGN